MMLSLEEVLSKSEARLNGLNRAVKVAAIELIKRAYAEGVPILITQGLRTIAEQDALYAQGRTKPGAVVTNARGGYSYHNFGVAVDFALLMPNGTSVSWDMKQDIDKDGKWDWSEVVAEAKKLGFEWGGDWTSFKDYPHFQMVFGLTTSQLRSGKRPTTAQEDAIINKIGDDYMMKEVDANYIIKTHLQPAWAVAHAKGDTKGKQEIGRLANELRRASGQPIQ